MFTTTETRAEKVGSTWLLRTVLYKKSERFHNPKKQLKTQSSGAVWKSRWPSWAPVPNKPTVSVDVKQYSAIIKSVLLSRSDLVIFSYCDKKKKKKLCLLCRLDSCTVPLVTSWACGNAGTGNQANWSGLRTRNVFLNRSENPLTDSRERSSQGKTIACITPQSSLPCLVCCPSFFLFFFSFFSLPSSEHIKPPFKVLVEKNLEAQLLPPPPFPHTHTHTHTHTRAHTHILTPFEGCKVTGIKVDTAKNLQAGKVKGLIKECEREEKKKKRSSAWYTLLKLLSVP